MQTDVAAPARAARTASQPAAAARGSRFDSSRPPCRFFLLVGVCLHLSNSVLCHVLPAVGCVLCTSTDFVSVGCRMDPTLQPYLWYTASHTPSSSSLTHTSGCQRWPLLMQHGGSCLAFDFGPPTASSTSMIHSRVLYNGGERGRDLLVMVLLLYCCNGNADNLLFLSYVQTGTFYNVFNQSIFGSADMSQVSIVACAFAMIRLAHLLLLRLLAVQ